MFVLKIQTRTESVKKNFKFENVKHNWGKFRQWCDEECDFSICIEVFKTACPVMKQFPLSISILE